MGDDCLDPIQSQNQTGNIAKASALLNAAQLKIQDMTCTGLDDEDNPTGDESVTCTAFGGEPEECKIAVGGISGCCEKPSNVSMADYLVIIYQVLKLDGAILSLEGEGGMVKSAYQTLRQPVMEAWAEFAAIHKLYGQHLRCRRGGLVANRGAEEPSHREAQRAGQEDVAGCDG